MLTNFFSNSKPFHFISINLLLFVGYTLYNFQISNFEHGIIELILSTFKFSLYIALMLIFGFIIKKNKLTQINSYALFSFGCFLLMVPILFQDSKPVFSLLFLLMSQFKRNFFLSFDLNYKLDLDLGARQKCHVL